jgi:hypothetical protein
MAAVFFTLALLDFFHFCPCPLSSTLLCFALPCLLTYPGLGPDDRLTVLLQVSAGSRSRKAWLAGWLAWLKDVAWINVTQL